MGASVTFQNPALLTLLDLSQIEISVPVSEGQVTALTPGQTVEYSTADGSKKSATLRAVMAVGTDGADDFVVRLQVNAADLPLAFRDDQPVDVFFNP